MKGIYSIFIFFLLPIILIGQKLDENPNFVKPDKSKALIRMLEFEKQRSWPQETFPVDARESAIEQEKVMRHKLSKNANMALAAQPEWVNVGPFNIGGRVKSIAVHPTDPQTVYIGAAAGGIWKTTNGGAAWAPIFDFENSIAMGSIAIDRNNPDILYAGTGEAVVSGGNIYDGSGMYKSTDAGETWQLIGLSKVSAFSKVFVHPLNSDLIIAGAVMNDQGFYRSTDAGASWEKLFDKSVSDVTININDELEYFIGVNNEGVYRSTDGGLTWAKRNNGIEDAQAIGRVSVQMSKSDENILYALMERGGSRDGWIYKSTNKGQNWSVAFNTPGVIFGSNTQGFYDNYIEISPTSSSFVYAGGIELWYTKDGGKNWLSVQQTTTNGNLVHVDQHHAAFAPSTPEIIYVGNDGGVYKSPNSGLSWEDANTGLMITQFYAMDIDLTKSQTNYGGTQDNGTLGNYSSNNYGAIFGGDGFDVLVDPNNPHIVIGELYYGQMWRRDLEKGSAEYIGQETAISDTGAWHSPIIRDKNFPQLMYHGKREIYTSYNGGDSWQQLTFDGRGGKFSCIASSPVDPNNVIAGNSVADVVVSKDNGITWNEVHQNGLISRFVTDVQLSYFEANTSYISYSGYGNPHIFKTTDMGDSWTDISQNLPDVPVNCIALHPYSKDVLFVGTDIGVYASFDDGNNWLPYGKNLPRSPILDLKFHTNNQIHADLKIRAATHGRSIFETIVPDEGITEAAITKPAGGEKLISSSSSVISWYGFPGAVKIEYSINNGAEWRFIADNVTGGSMLWNVPNADSYLCKIKITAQDESVSLVSNTFTISKKQKGDVIQQGIFNHAPYGIAFDGENSLYTTSFYENKLYKLNANDLSISSIYELPSGSYYTGIAIDRKNKNIYVHRMTGEGGGGGYIFKLDYEGKLISQRNSPVKNYPTGLAFLNGYLYANDRDGQQLIYQFDYEANKVVQTFENPYKKDLGPRGLCSTPDNTLMQVCTEFPNSGALNEALILEMNINNSATEKQRMQLRNQSGLLNGRGVEFDPNTTDIWASTFNGDIVKLAGFNTVVSVNNDMLSSELIREMNIYPNPVNNISRMNFIPDFSGEIEIVLTDLIGNALINSVASVGAGIPFEQEINLSDFANGVYQIGIFRNGELIYVNRLIKI